jgi:hypothetical protein
MAIKLLTNIKYISYKEIPKHISCDHWITTETTTASYVEFTLSVDSSVDDKVCAWIRQTYPELIGTKFLIHIDY